MPWNLHEKCPGQFDFDSDNLDFAEYFKIAQNLGLHVICRPGPYICSEWDWGGLPHWLGLIYDRFKVRSGIHHNNVTYSVIRKLY